jgi:molybdenum cofactor synthesis domain-containing protein
MADRPRTATVVTISDGVAHGARQDASGAALAERLVADGWDVVDRVTVPDEVDDIGRALVAAADAGRALVVTTGGTGLGPRDVTPEATRAVADRPVPGMAEAMRAAGRASTPMADLSRGEVVAIRTTLVVNTPGSVRGAVESLDAVLGLLPHATQLLGGDTRDHPTGHGTGSVPHPGAGGATHPTDAVEGELHPHTPVVAPQDHAGHDHARDDSSGHDHASTDGRGGGHHHADDDPCALAHAPGVPDDRRPGKLVAVYASPVAATLLDWGRGLGYRRLVLVEPDPDLEAGLDDAAATAARHARAHADVVVTTLAGADVDGDTDVVVTDHDRDGLSDVADAMLRSGARWLGLMGSLRHTGPHVAPLLERGWSEQDVATIHRPIGLDIGSRTPPEIALATLAGLVADRQGRTGGLSGG